MGFTFFDEKNKVDAIKFDPTKYVFKIPPPKEVDTIHRMLTQIEVWINAGEWQLVEKHWDLIADQCVNFSLEAKKQQ